MKINKYIFNNKIINILRILQAYRMSKKYYRNKLFEFNIKKK